MSAYTIDPSKPTLPDNYERMASWDVAPIMEGSTELCSTIQDNDCEIWHLTSAGQFVRQTGELHDQYYVVPKAEAHEFLKDWAAEEVMDGLNAVGAFNDVDTNTNSFGS